AHTGELEVLADQSVSVTATDERIDVLAKEKIVLQAGQTKVTLEGRNITFECPGNFTVKGAQGPFRGGATSRSGITALPAKLFSDAIHCFRPGKTGSESNNTPRAVPAQPVSMGTSQSIRNN